MGVTHNQSPNSRRFRLLNVIDDYNFEALAVEVNFSFLSELLIRTQKNL